MLPASRDALRTERYLDDLMTADERHSGSAPADLDTDRDVRAAAAALRSGLVRVHPSFRFEEALSGRLAAAALRMGARLPVEAATSAAADRGAAAVAAFPGAVATTAVEPATVAPAGRGAVLRRIPEIAARQSRPLMLGGVGVASAAISLGAFYVAWRHTHAAPGRMGRAARTAHGRAAQSGRRRSGIVEEIIGVVS
jgi:hypothetical protein